MLTIYHLPDISSHYRITIVFYMLKTPARAILNPMPSAGGLHKEESCFQKWIHSPKMSSIMAAYVNERAHCDLGALCASIQPASAHSALPRARGALWLGAVSGKTGGGGWEREIGSPLVSLHPMVPLEANNPFVVLIDLFCKLDSPSQHMSALSNIVIITEQTPLRVSYAVTIENGCLSAEDVQLLCNHLWWHWFSCAH